MINVKMITKPKGGKGGGGGSGTSGSSSSKVTYIQGVATEAEHATRADKAKQAENAEQAGYASTAGTAERANYAAKAGDVDADAEGMKKFLRTDLEYIDDVKEFQRVNGGVRFAHGLAVSNDEAEDSNEPASFYMVGSALFSGVTYIFGQLTNMGGIHTNALEVDGQATVKNLTVTGTAHFFDLIIDKVRSAGGAALFTPADGFDIERVEEMAGVGYKLWWRAQDNDDNQRNNMWLPGDQALCMSFNKADAGGNVSNKYYWAVVTETSNNSSKDSFGWSIEGENILGNWIVLSSTDCDGTLNPEIGDTIVMLGHRAGYEDGLSEEERTARQSAIYISAYTSLDKGLTAPLIAQYHGIDDFDLASHRQSYWAANGSKFIGDVELGGGKTLEDYIKENMGDAKDGKDGKDGKGITSIITKYYTWSSNKDLSASRIWNYGTTTMPGDFNDDFPWLWMMSRTYYTDGTYDDSNAVCLGYKAKDGSSYKLEPYTETAIVTADKKLGVSLAYYIYLVSGKTKTLVNDSTFSVRYRFDTDSSTTNLSKDSNSRYSVTVTNKDFANQDYVEVELLASSGETVLDRRIVPVRYATSASLEVNNTLGTITSRVTGCETSIGNNAAAIESQGSIISRHANSIAEIQQKADSIEMSVKANTTSINTINGKVLSMQSDVSTVKQTASSITSTVSSLQQKMKGDNIMPGQNGAGWTGAGVWQDAGSSFALSSTTEWLQSPGFEDYGDDYLFSFATWNGRVTMEVWEFDQQYDSKTSYDIDCDFGTRTVGTVLKSNTSASSSTITGTLGASGKSTTFSIASGNLDDVKVGDMVAVKVLNTTTAENVGIYGEVTAKTSSTVTITAFGVLPRARRVCSAQLADASTDASNKDLNKFHLYTENGGERAWLRWKSLKSSAKTFVLRFRLSSSSTSGWIARFMLEENVEVASPYASSQAVTQSMIRQSASEILMQVNNTYLQIGDGNITLNGDTKVNGTLTLNDEGQGFILDGATGATQISPKSIGTYDDFSAISSITMPLRYSQNVIGADAVTGSRYEYNWTAQIKLGTVKSGSYVQLKNLSVSARKSETNNSDAFGSPYVASSELRLINGSGTLLKSTTSSSGLTYTATSDCELIAQVVCRAYQIKQSDYDLIDDSKRPIRMNTIVASVSLDCVLPTSKGYMLVGNDGIAINFGTNQTVFIGKSGAVFNYGTYRLEISEKGIRQGNRRNIKVLSGGSKNFPSTYQFGQDDLVTDTVIATGDYTYIIFPSYPYEGQQIKIFDKSPSECRLCSNGKYVVGASESGTGKLYGSLSGGFSAGFELDGFKPRTYTYANGRWYEEYMGF